MSTDLIDLTGVSLAKKPLLKYLSNGFLAYLIKRKKMQELLIQALDSAAALVERQLPQTKPETKSVGILDVKPIDLIDFMATQGIPDDAFFSGQDNGYDAWDNILLCWEIKVPTTPEDCARFRVKRFPGVAAKFVYDLLVEQGYRRIPLDSKLLRGFLDSSLYPLYATKNFDALVEYYSLFFTKD